MALRLSDTSAGASSGKNFSTGSSSFSLPSSIASPTAVALKLLLSDAKTCGLSAASGFHHPSPITCPCRTIMKLWSVLILSAASTNSQTACDEMPWASGVLRGSDMLAAWTDDAALSATAMIGAKTMARFLMFAFPVSVQLAAAIVPCTVY